MLVKNSLEEITKIYGAIEEIGYVNNFGEELIDELCICMDEIFSNILSYAFDDVGEHDIEIDFRFDESNKKLTTTIIDDGREFNPLEVEAPDLSLDIMERQIGGLGVFIVSNIMSLVEYSRRGDRNHLMLIKTIG